MNAEIMSIGDEILIGQITNTNAVWMAQQLNLAGIHVKQITSVSDDRGHIMQALREAEERADIILITGGLGPTKDDITKVTLCEYFNTSLRFDEEIYKDVERLFKSFGREVTPVNRKQAEVPENCIPLRNEMGTAPGMWFERGGKIFVSMPGVPYEMKGIMEKYVLPKLTERFELPAIVHVTVLTQGIGESALAEKIEEWEDALAADNIKLAYLPSPGMVRLRLSVSGEDRDQLEKLVDKKIQGLKEIIPGYIYGYESYGAEEDVTLEQIVGQMLRERKQTVSTSESCTGGYISHLITKVPGSSEYYQGSVIAYSYEVKEKELGVDKKMLEEHGAVSQPVVEQMAIGARKKLNTDYSIAASGIAGPGGGTADKPVGTVWIAVATPGKVISKRFQFGENREWNIHRTALAGLNMLRQEMLQYSK
jgi:nicotinamide-nucleotide amidase